LIDGQLLVVVFKPGFIFESFFGDRHSKQRVHFVIASGNAHVDQQMNDEQSFEDNSLARYVWNSNEMQSLSQKCRLI